MGWNGVVLCWRGYKMVTVTATSHQTSVFLAGSSIGITSPVSRLYGHVREFNPGREEKVIVMLQVTEIYGRENGWGALT